MRWDAMGGGLIRRRSAESPNRHGDKVSCRMRSHSRTASDATTALPASTSHRRSLTAIATLQPQPRGPPWSPTDDLSSYLQRWSTEQEPKSPKGLRLLWAWIVARALMHTLSTLTRAPTPMDGSFTSVPIRKLQSQISHTAAIPPADSGTTPLPLLLSVGTFTRWTATLVPGRLSYRRKKKDTNQSRLLPPRPNL